MGNSSEGAPQNPTKGRVSRRAFLIKAGLVVGAAMGAAAGASGSPAKTEQTSAPKSEKVSPPEPTTVPSLIDPNKIRNF